MFTKKIAPMKIHFFLNRFERKKTKHSFLQRGFLIFTMRVCADIFSYLFMSHRQQLE